MARDLVALKVKIGTKGSDWPKPEERGHALYPNFNQLQAVIDSGMDWSKYVDHYGEAWHYDKKCGHKQEEPDSPRGMQWGMLIVPKEFADEAVTMFPKVCSVVNESVLEDFWDNCAHAHEPEERLDDVVLRGIEAKKVLGKELTPGQERALDPEDDTPGIRKNHQRYWADYKAKQGIKIIA